MEYDGQAGFRPYVDALLERLGKQPERVVLRHLDGDVTAGELRSAIFRHARVLSALGIGRGALVAQLAPNCPEALAIRYAANLLGAATLFVPALSSKQQRAALLARIKPTLLVVFRETVQLIPDDFDGRVMFVGIGPESARLDRLAQRQADLPLRGDARADELAVLVSSGGTTGVPKCSRRSFATYSEMVSAPANENRRQLINGPLAYLSQVLVDMTLIGGGTVVLRPRYVPAETLATIESERITDALMVEPQLFETMDHPDVSRRDLSSLRSVMHVGGSAPAVLRERAIARLGPVLTHMYGASELGPVSVLAPSEYAANKDVLNTAGRIRAGVELRVRRADGTLATTGQSGTLEVKSASVAQGYYHQPYEDAKKFRDGWCLTGDVGFIDEACYLHVTGRAADVAEIDGMAIGPTQIEDVLCRLPDVRYAVALAANHATGEYAWNVLIEPWVGQVKLARCMHRLNVEFGPFVAGRIRFLIVDKVPHTEQGKVDRVAIEKMIPDDLQSNYHTFYAIAPRVEPAMHAA
ncbi:class I adenylate-forming enzyme family protein [Paraburkholderia sp. DHOC27]|uniref:class I adenylate-forming enzyme family protein n=1 Tax=Paraburkholderia sp. DHOC27 TaxID=2303330 RepID=UPI000E3ED4AF|nr:AMP-binding protein [Paraburkholderia sp. DHOC27]RFU44797.1 long-chain fatty acid--CoA ligase [Paraburkholderia sp. DHOC27]